MMMCAQVVLLPSLLRMHNDTHADHHERHQHRGDVVIAATDRVLPDPRIEPTIAVARGSRILGLSTRAGYMAAERGDWPVVRVGRSIRILTAKFLAQYGLDDGAA
jgi:hypothetical protein